MGKTYQFECPLCQYRVRVSGGADAGLDCEVQTVMCRDCRELFDVFTRVRWRSMLKEKFSPLRPQIPPLALRLISSANSDWEKATLLCPASAKHRVVAWNDPGRCPRCGCFLEKNGLPFRIWD